MKANQAKASASPRPHGFRVTEVKGMTMDVIRLTRLQKAILAYMTLLGGEHVYISRTTAPPPNSDLAGFTWEGVNLSLSALVKRGVIRKSGANDGFFTITGLGGKQA